MRVTGQGMLAGGVTLAVVVLATSVLSGRQPAQVVNVPGMPTIARTLVVNGAGEPVPVVLAASGQVQPVTLVETPAVVLAAGSAVVSRAGRQGWEYRSVTVRDGEDPAAALGAAGLEGWEAVGVTGGTGNSSRVLLKRPR
jgi:hypothetical protein